MQRSPDRQILTLRELLSDDSLSIPLYQRPYKWTAKNVNQLFIDIVAHRDKSSYRLGTIVFHQEGEKKNIVDGQQRIITLLLAIRALSELRQDNLEREDLKEYLNHLKRDMIVPSFKSIVSKTNIQNNYLEICRIIGRSDFTEENIDFFLNKCEVVTFILSDISEAFQFFDSQNARGRDLEPHDLLKAYHLREFHPEDEVLKISTVEKWENSKTKDLAILFSQYLYRIRNWSKGSSSRYFGKEETVLFKGVNIDITASYPYVKQLQITHHFVDCYNQSYERKIDGHNLRFPFHLDQIIINGRRFFEMVAHYQELINEYFKVIEFYQENQGEKNKKFVLNLKLISINELDGDARAILKTIDEYEGHKRTGDQYVRMIFDCLLIYYIDKFGHAQISRAIEKIFIWAYSLRLKLQVVQLASIDNYVLENNLFKLVQESIKPDDFMNCTLPVLLGVEKKSTKTERIEQLFKEMKYYE
ncbi:DUF262 domain-containing protein [Picosynechococcus sp. PCC 7117]|uniref:DUF262 domain-containing protein n=1 Tax=Picosynechococcus sp. PCC 7117 TaxID=195498 RepID=UPI000810C7A0|nr:DUF262 domain-containing protein [Picosynechococcus sp. PCC 7117]ANV89049.1 hypothetical protein AWQ22_15765 [Picosynechococcus sp. PCC 7117]